MYLTLNAFHLRAFSITWHLVAARKGEGSDKYHHIPRLNPHLLDLSFI